MSTVRSVTGAPSAGPSGAADGGGVVSGAVGGAVGGTVGAPGGAGGRSSGTASVTEQQQAEHLVRLVQAALEDLRSRSGLESWALARRDGEDYVVLGAVGEAIGRPGDARVVAWDDTFCAQREDHGAPAVAADARAVPQYRRLVEQHSPRVRAVVTVPVLAPDGEWLGHLCGLGTEVDPGVERQLAAVELQAALLGSLLACEVHLIRERRRAEHAELAAHTDPLTGLGNRRAWDAGLAAEEARAALVASSVGVLVADVDGLKAVNDEAGHAAGDDVLAAAAEALRTVVRPEDLVARLGGDELGVLVPDADERTMADLLGAARAAWASRGVEVSAGWALRHAATGLRDAWRRADTAMYLDKGRRRLERADDRVAAGGALPTVPPDGLPLVGAGAPARDVDALLELVSAQLGLEVAYVNERRGNRWRIRNAHAEPDAGLVPGAESEVTDSFCELMVQGRLPVAVPDVAQVPELLALPTTAALGIGAWVGTPLHRSDGRLYGTLCAYSRSAEPGLGERDAGVLRVVGGLVMNILERHDAEDTARHALLERLDGLQSRGGPSMVFQPVVALADGTVVGHEALSRFPSGDPGEWFASARCAGVEEELELSAVRSALARHADLPGFLAVNVSARTACLPAMARALDAVDPARVVLELTEHTPVDDYDALRAAVRPLRDRGVRLAVDDVGAGFASMRHVLELVPDVLKLDISLVRNIATDPARQALAASMLAFAGSTGAVVVAEGIETADELEHLRAMGVQLGQGYHLGRPAPLPEPARVAG
ncbi:sensor domain-containing protein [Cellulomonas marina]|uniref:Diguanylate cyclase (GGDEF) domain-containing protein n=1 Tax=Cellulomonas marina TaxID=988821 RepID=A0A1I0X7K9_9CELL|nr:GGDEF domain-containing phosphodiesterase [Cellulomonas marina]GIG28973.1 hypothetical protein Cma02nite_15730 [Cellulomonas marina]SFA96350.1 diguanylate cyclase (GGDEF) domain-containing protein [Cellulomonas marina]